ncbi:MAG: hypothetical protein F4145_00560 [Boseongicola sp. SB0675_bin_26]|nr:hypothetical protein [Boseongicola sp. SB0675_bin_26]
MNLVAEIADGGSFVAVQCKFHTEGKVVSKA